MAFIRARSRRPPRWLRTAFSAAIATALAASSAPLLAGDPLAAKKPDAAALAQAKTHFTAGLKLYKEGSVREALAEFLVANKLVPRASVSQNIAQCYRDLHEFATAYAKYSDLLATYGASMKPAEADDTKRAITELSALTGTVTVKIAEPGATVTLDDKDLGVTPIAAPSRVNIGAHTVVVAKAGFDTLTRKVEIQGGDDVAVDAPLVKEILTGHLAVTAAGVADASVRISIDGREVGPPPWEGDLPPGPHEVTAEGEASRAGVQRVELARAAKIDLPITLKPRTGHLMIDPHQIDAEIKVDGVVKGTGVWEGDVKIGRHDVTVEAPGFLAYQRVLLVHDDDKIVEGAVLKPKPRDERLDYIGFYGGTSLGFTVSPNPTDDYSQACRSGASCDKSGPSLGLANQTINVGYSFGLLSIEAVGVFRLDITNVTTTFPADAGNGRTGPARQEQFSMTRIVGAGGLGGRITTKGSVARFTFGTSILVGRDTVKGNISFNNFNPPFQLNANQNQNCNDSGNGCVSESAVKTVPILLFDGGLLLGSTPGVRFKLGAIAEIEFPGDMVAQSGSSESGQVCTNGMNMMGGPTCSGVTIGVPPIKFNRGPQFFVGPTLGLQFGH